MKAGEWGVEIPPHQPVATSSGSCDSDYRVHFFNSFRLVTTAVATADGALSPERSTAIDQIFWLDRPDAAAQAEVNSATPDQIEAAGATLAVVVLLALIVIGIVLWRHTP